jgi:hypothetical protein
MREDIYMGGLQKDYLASQPSIDNCVIRFRIPGLAPLTIYNLSLNSLPLSIGSAYPVAGSTRFGKIYTVFYIINLTGYAQRDLTVLGIWDLTGNLLKYTFLPVDVGAHRVNPPYISSLTIDNSGNIYISQAGGVLAFDSDLNLFANITAGSSYLCQPFLYISAAGNTLYASISQNPLATVNAYYAPCNNYVNPYYAYGFGYSKPILIYALGNLSLLKSLSMTGSIYGVVRSYRGAGVGGVEVVANLIGNNWVKPYRAITNGTGYYSITLPSGIYKLAFYPPQGSGLAPLWYQNASGMNSAASISLGPSAFINISVVLQSLQTANFSASPSSIWYAASTFSIYPPPYVTRYLPGNTKIYYAKEVIAITNVGNIPAHFLYVLVTPTGSAYVPNFSMIIGGVLGADLVARGKYSVAIHLWLNPLETRYVTVLLTVPEFPQLPVHASFLSYPAIPIQAAALPDVVWANLTATYGNDSNALILAASSKSIYLDQEFFTNLTAVPVDQLNDTLNKLSVDYPDLANIVAEQVYEYGIYDPLWLYILNLTYPGTIFDKNSSNFSAQSQTNNALKSSLELQGIRTSDSILSDIFSLSVWETFFRDFISDPMFAEVEDASLCAFALKGIANGLFFFLPGLIFKNLAPPENPPPGDYPLFWITRGLLTPYRIGSLTGAVESFLGLTGMQVALGTGTGLTTTFRSRLGWISTGPIRDLLRVQPLNDYPARGLEILVGEGPNAAKYTLIKIGKNVPRSLEMGEYPPRLYLGIGSVGDKNTWLHIYGGLRSDLNVGRIAFRIMGKYVDIPIPEFTSTPGFTYIPIVASASEKTIPSYPQAPWCGYAPLTVVENTAPHDPNQLSISPPGYLKEVRPDLFTLKFENEANATAPAHDVVIRIRVSEMFNLSSTMLLYSDHMESLASLRINESSNEIIITFKGIDLPPDINPPEGQAVVSFYLTPKSSIKSGDILWAYADIYFDNAAPVRTNNVTQIFDTDPPRTVVQAVSSNTTIRITGIAVDDSSGVKHTLIEARDILTGNMSIARVDAAQPSRSMSINSIMNPSPGGVYIVRAYSEDFAGNIENKPLDLLTATPPAINSSLSMISGLVDNRGAFSANSTSINGIDVEISGAPDHAGAPILVVSFRYSSPPPGVKPLPGSPIYMDVWGTSVGGVASICVRDPQIGMTSSIYYYNNLKGEWARLNATIRGSGVICGQIDEKILRGTPIAVLQIPQPQSMPFVVGGELESPSIGPSIGGNDLEGYIGLYISLAIASMLIIAYIYRKEREA